MSWSERGEDWWSEQEHFGEPVEVSDWVQDELPLWPRLDNQSTSGVE